MSNVFNIADRPGRDTRLLDQARDAAIPPLVDAFAMALGRFDDALFDRAERAGPSQMAFLDAMRELRRRREDIVVRFRAHLQRAWKARQEGQPLSMETAFAQGADDTLTLVTDQELESRLAVRNLASVIQRDCKPVLLRLDRRLGWIAGDVALDSDLNPIGPEHIGVAVHQAFSACDLAPEVRLVVIKLCERDLVPAIARIYAALDQRLGGGTAPEPTARLAPVDEDAIDLVGMLFDVMLDERDLEGRPRELIGRLVVPFVKVALLDRRMFVQKTHPARRLLNVLAEACEGNNGESAAERTLLTKVEEVIDRLVAEFNENLAIFLTLEEEFRAFLEQHRRRIEIAERRAAEIQRGQERLEAARTRMAAELDERLADRRVPQAIEDFLRQPWAHHVTMTVLREGEEGEGLRESLALADGLLEELTEAQRHVIGKPWLQAWRPALLKVFASVGLNQDAAGGAVDALHDTLQAVAAARPDLEKALPELPQVVLPKPAVDEEATPIQLVGGADTLDFDHSDADHFRGLPIGTWLDFIDKDNKVQAGKLSWVSPISSRLLFVNRRGVRFCVASPEELAAMVRLGRLRTHQSEDAFDSAMQGVIERLEPTPSAGIPS